MLMIICIIILGGCGVVYFGVEKTKSNTSDRVKHRLQWWRKEVGCTDIDAGVFKSNHKVSIAIVDSGIDEKNRNLANVEIEQINCVDVVKKQKLDHGTAIAGIIAGWPADEKGVMGICPNAKFFDICVTNTDSIEVAELIKGIDCAIENDVDIINISIGIKNDNEKLHDVIKKAYDKGIIIIAAAGNYIDDGSVLYPAGYEEVLAIGSYGKNGEIISPLPKREDVIYLPGENIVSCIGENEYAGCKGTSFSTAIMTGMVADVINEIEKGSRNKKIFKVVDKLGKENKININELRKEIDN